MLTRTKKQKFTPEGAFLQNFESTFVQLISAWERVSMSCHDMVNLRLSQYWDVKAWLVQVGTWLLCNKVLSSNQFPSHKGIHLATAIKLKYVGKQ